jgi:polysaccharide export outer membrane protein
MLKNFDFRAIGAFRFTSRAAPLLRRAGFVLSGAALLVACGGGPGGPIPYRVAEFGAPDASPVVSLDEDYRISPLDKLQVTVYREPELSGDYDVDLRGIISLPLIGAVKAGDLTAAQLGQQLARLFGAKYLQSPDVSVAIKASSTRSVTVDGSVHQPGMFPVTGRLSLLQVIALAHGTDENANPHRVAIFRRLEGQRMAAAFDLTAIRRGEAEDPRIYNGDIIVVDGSNTKSAFKQIMQAVPMLAIFRPF